jgi:serine/threonine protein kinase
MRVTFEEFSPTHDFFDYRAHLGPYKILAPLGVGGMGEVFRAKDTRLGRDVAVKVLPEAFAKDADRLRRFEQEAKTNGRINVQSEDL